MRRFLRITEPQTKAPEPRNMKRKASSSLNGSEDDSDCIVVNSHRSGRAARPATSLELKLTERHGLDSARNQNKRQRLLQCVLVNKHDDIEHSNRRDSRLASSTSTPSPPQPNGSAELSDRQPIAYTNDVSDSNSSNRRPRRAAAVRRSYVELQLDDALEHESTAAYILQRHRRAPSQESEFEEGVADSADDAEMLTDNGSFDDGSSVSPSEPESDASPALPVREPPSTKTAKGKQTAGKGKGETPVVNGKTIKGTSKDMKDIYLKSKGMDADLPPMSNITEIFADLTEKAVKLGLNKAIEHLDQHTIRVATMCSGTESPLLALQMIEEALKESAAGTIRIDHLFSAEKDPVKQAYIERNFAPPIIFRDVVELTKAVNDELPMATTVRGALVPIPGHQIDLLIAGTSCKDYSALNQHKKGKEDSGESGNTWHAVLAYCKAFRPKMVILENVKTAPWDAMLQDYREADYEVAGVALDSKDFYMPQTRQRGYMVCFDKGAMRAETQGDQGLGSKFEQLMAKFRRRVSSPVSSFLLPSDQVQRQLRNDVRTREVDWSKCEITQMKYRKNNKLGTDRSFTGWQESGTMLPPENNDRLWWSTQVDRVKDTYDCKILKKARDAVPYDARYKTRIWDLSQNVYYNEDAGAFGISQCLTPTGQFFISDAGRQLTAEELLVLQGMPLSRMSFTVESAAELQDLAGNAMTTTVVGSAILSTLICGYKMIEPDSKTQSLTDASPQRTAIAPAPTLEVAWADAHKSDEVEMARLLTTARESMRRCYCEGARGMAETIQQCLDCGHTMCTACGGNPRHNYRQSLTAFADRLDPSRSEDLVRSLLPLKLSFCGSECPSSSGKAPPFAARYLDAFKVATDTTFSFSHVRRTHCWTAVYESPKGKAHLDLVVNDSTAEWHLYALPDASLSQNDELRQTLQHPIAKSRLQETFGKQQCWLFRMPTKATIDIKIEGNGKSIPSFWARHNMPDYEDHTVPEFLRIEASPAGPASQVLEESIDGTYRYLPQCGSAFDSLFVRDGGRGPMFLLLDPTRTGDPKDDQFVFTKNRSLLEYDEVRAVVARVDPRWRPWSTGKPPWSSFKSTTAKITVDGVWSKAKPAFRFEVTPTNLQLRKPERRTGTSGDCTLAALFVEATAPFDHMEVPLAPGGIMNADRKLLKNLAWSFEAIRRTLPTSEWHNLDIADLSVRCTTCAPLRPKLRWRLGQSNTRIRPLEAFEDAQGARLYEMKVKSRPEPIVVEVSGEKINLGFNLETLAHRAAARLPLSSTAAGRKAQWRLDTGSGGVQVPHAAFQLSATKGVQPYTADLGMSVRLFPGQQRALACILQQEAGKNFTLEEGEEAILPEHKWRAEVRVQASIHVRGGICADHPGFGKTVVMLALVQQESRQKSAAAVLNDLRARQHGAATLSGLIPLAATLIVCPLTLVPQWVDEIKEKLGYSDALVIKTAGDLDKYTTEDFQKTKIVVLNRSVLPAESYADRLAEFAGVPGPASMSGRPYEKWREYAASQAREHTQLLQASGLEETKRHVAKKFKDLVNDETFKTDVPSLSTSNTSNAEKTGKAKSAAIARSRIGKPLFEQFYFNRLVFDEFHEYEPKERVALRNLRADKRWGLSGTPALSDAYDVAQMAGLLEIPLRVGSDVRGRMKVRNIREFRKDMTDFERFDALCQKPSDSTHLRIMEIGQLFLDTFVRQNVMDYAEELQLNEHLVPVHLHLTEQALYLELSQHLNSQDMRIRRKGRERGTKNQAEIAYRDTDRQNRLFKAAADAETAEEALSRLAAFFDQARSSLDDLIRSREDDVVRFLTELGKVGQRAKKAEAEDFVDWRQTTLVNNGLGDAETIADIEAALAGRVETTTVSSDPDTSDAEDKASKRPLTTRTNRLGKKLLIARRSLRYLQHVRNVESLLQHHPERPVKCDAAGCGSNHKSINQHMAISAFCGHTLCGLCYDMSRARHETRCTADGCASQMHDYHLLWSHKMGKLVTSPTSRFGAKWEATIRILQKIAKRQEQAILFVQYPNQLLEAESALAGTGIAATVVKQPNAAGKQIASFRKKETNSTVIVLNASDETAAGSNLQNANHVIFLSPLLRDTQYGYASTMAQAIGRVRRFGQERPIHVYHIVALDTIDVDILEHRMRRTEALGEEGGEKIRQPPGVDRQDGEVVAERTQLVREGAGFSLRPRSWLVRGGVDADVSEAAKVKGRGRVLGWEDYSSLVKFSKAYTEDDD